MIKLVITFYLSIYLFIIQPQTPDRDHPRKRVKEPCAADDELEKLPRACQQAHPTGARERGFLGSSISLLDSFSSKGHLFFSYSYVVIAYPT